MGLGDDGESLVFCENFLIVGDGIWLLSVEDFDGFEPIHDCTDLLFWKLLEIANLFQEILTPFLLAYSASIIRTFQSTSP